MSSDTFAGRRLTLSQPFLHRGKSEVLGRSGTCWDESWRWRQFSIPPLARPPVTNSPPTPLHQRLQPTASLLQPLQQHTGTAGFKCVRIQRLDPFKRPGGQGFVLRGFPRVSNILRESKIVNTKKNPIFSVSGVRGIFFENFLSPRDRPSRPPHIVLAHFKVPPP